MSYYEETEARRLVIEAGLRLVREGLIARTWGNISARISENEFVITPSGRAYETMRPDDLVKVRIRDLTVIGDGKGVAGWLLVSECEGLSFCSPCENGSEETCAAQWISIGCATLE